MDTYLVLENLNKLDDVRYFIRSLEIKFLSDNALSIKLNVASKFLDQALVQIAFDLQKRIDSGFSSLEKGKISNKISHAFDQLNDVRDQSLDKCFQDLLLFAQKYESNLYQIDKAENEQNFENLRDKILLIIAERFS